MGNLTNQFIKNTYDGLIKLNDSTAGIQPTLQPLTDGLGNPLPAKVSETEFIITGSLHGTASYAENVESASHAINADNAINATSSSYALTASFAENVSGDIYVSGGTFYSSSGVVPGHLPGDLDLYRTEGEADVTINLDGRYQTLAGAQSGDLRIQILENEVDSLQIESASIRSDFNTFTSSQDSTNTDVDGRLDSLETESGSIHTYTSSMNNFTASQEVTNTEDAARLDSIEQKTGSFATTGSNVFTGEQTINNDLIISGNLYVSGSETIISSSTLVVGDREIELNANRTVGNAGIIVYDVVSPEGTGSLQWDATNDYWMAGQYGSEERILTSLDTGSLSVQDAQRTIMNVKNVHGSTIPKGTPCFITDSGTSGNLVGVVPADNSNASLMPAGVVLDETLNAGDEGIGVVVGFIQNISTTGFTSGDSIWVNSSGGYTNVRPIGSGNFVQKIGNVIKVHQNNGSIEIMGAGRANDIPNIAEGNFFVGDINGVGVSVSTGSFARRDEANTFTQAQTIDGSTQLYVNGLLETTGQNLAKGGIEVTGSANISGSMNLIQGKPAVGTQANIIDIEGQLGYYAGFPSMTQTNVNLSSYSSQQYNGVVVEMWDSPSFNWGTDVAISPNGFFHNTVAKDTGQVAELEAYSTSGGSTFVNVKGRTINIGAEQQTNLIDVAWVGPATGTTRVNGETVNIGSPFGFTQNIDLKSITGLTLDSPSIEITGSVSQDVDTIAIASATASIDFSNSNYQTLTLASGTATHLIPTNIKAGQTVVVEITQDGALAGTVTVDGSLTFPGGTPYTATTTLGGKDVLTLVSFDGSTVRAAGNNDFS